MPNLQPNPALARGQDASGTAFCDASCTLCSWTSNRGTAAVQRLSSHPLFDRSDEEKYCFANLSQPEYELMKKDATLPLTCGALHALHAGFPTCARISKTGHEQRLS